MLRRLERDTILVVVMLAGLALVWRPSAPRTALGVMGGGLLIGFAYWAIRGLADGLGRAGNAPENRRYLRGVALVKFFTRHAILALAAYGMMARLQLDPISILIGASAPALAAAVEAVRTLRQ